MSDPEATRAGDIYVENITLNTGDTLGVINAGEESNTGEHGGSNTTIKYRQLYCSAA